MKRTILAIFAVFSLGILFSACFDSGGEKDAAPNAPDSIPTSPIASEPITVIVFNCSNSCQKMADCQLQDPSAVQPGFTKEDCVNECKTMTADLEQAAKDSVSACLENLSCQELLDADKCFLSSPQPKIPPNIGEDETVENILAALSIDLLVESSPLGAQVYLDDVQQGITPLNIRDLSPGSHRLKLTMCGFVDYDEVFDQTVGSNNIKSATLIPLGATGSLRVISIPPGATVSMGEKNMGLTERGITPFLRIDGQKFGQEYTVKAERAGFPIGERNYKQCRQKEAIFFIMGLLPGQTGP